MKPFFACLVCAGLVVGCKVFDPDLIDEGSAGLPPRPAASTSSAADNQELLFALKDVYIRSDQFANRIGLDLDDRITVDNSDLECQPRSENALAPIDGVNGIDNAVGRNLLPLVGGFLPCLEDDMALRQGEGLGTILLWITKWNGQDDDASVSAVLTTAVDGSPEDPARLRFGPLGDLIYNADIPAIGVVEGELAPPPGWAGDDRWYADPDDFGTDSTGMGDKNQPLAQQTSAYVSKGRIVVDILPGTPLKLFAERGSLDIEVTDGVLFADLSEDHNSLERGVFAGRFSIADLLAATPSIGLCSSLGAIIQETLGTVADVLVTPEAAGPEAICDALSLGVSFTGIRGTLELVARSTRPRITPCDPGPMPPTDFCCPSAVATTDGGVPDAGTTPPECSGTPEKWERFFELPEGVAVPVPEPNGF